MRYARSNNYRIDPIEIDKELPIEGLTIRTQQNIIEDTAKATSFCINHWRNTFRMDHADHISTNRTFHPMIIVARFLLLFCYLGTMSDGFLFQSTGVGREIGLESWRSTALFKSSTVAVTETESSSSTSDENPNVFQNQPLCPPVTREFEWWNDACDTYLDELDEAGGERFVASHDDPDETGKTNTNNWLHVTSSNPQRRVQYEIRYMEGTQTMGGVVRFGSDCEGPEGCAHGGSIASVADALTATCCFKAASERWGMTTHLDCNYREAIPLGTPVRVEATVVDLQKRKASLEWSIHSLTKLDRNENPVRHAFGSADFLLPRLPK